MVAEWAAVANCFGLVVLWRTGLPCKTLSGHGELSLNLRHSHVRCPSTHVVNSAWAGPHSCLRVSREYWLHDWVRCSTITWPGGRLWWDLFLACAGAVCMGWSDLLCHGASVGIRVGVCFCAHHVVSVVLRVWLLVFPPNRRCRYRGALFAMFPLVLGAGGCLALTCR